MKIRIRISGELVQIGYCFIEYFWILFYRVFLVYKENVIWDVGLFGERMGIQDSW